MTSFATLYSKANRSTTATWIFTFRAVHHRDARNGTHTMIYRLTAISTVNHISAVSAKYCNTIRNIITIPEASGEHICRRKCTSEKTGEAVSKTVVSVNARHIKRNDVDALNLPFQKTAKVRLFPMIPTMMSVPVISSYMKSVSS